MSLASCKRWSPRTRLFAFARVPQPLVEPVLHPSRWRIRALGLSCAIGHPLFYAIWTNWVPQPYERLWQRLAVSLLGLLPLALPSLQAQPPSRTATIVLSAMFWITLPVYFTWMYLCNERNAVWFATMCAMFLIYYQLTDWRIATIGIASGLVAGWGLFAIAGPPLPPTSIENTITHGVVFSFAWSMGLILGISSSNLRREQLRQALGTMGIMAHELRTPLSTIALIGDGFREQARRAPPDPGGSLTELTDRLHATVRQMNRHIDMQITNARLLQPPPPHERVAAAEVVHKAVQGFPYRNAYERRSVQVEVLEDFSFQSSQALFTQVLDNLIKNALRSMACLSEPPRPGDLYLQVAVAHGHGRAGRIMLRDRGIGIDSTLQDRLFQPFVSTNQDTGHGLGLAFCQRVVHASRGSIRVESAPGCGARFIIELPLV